MVGAPGRAALDHAGVHAGAEDGGAFVGWGGLQPYFSEFSADGRTVFDARFAPDGVESYRAYRRPWESGGEGEPTAVVRGNKVYASWNGATGVAAWRVRAGGEAVTAQRSGFETEIVLDAPADDVVVEAVDADRRVLGTTEAQAG